MNGKDGDFNISVRKKQDASLLPDNGIVESNAADIFKTDPVKLIFDVLRRSSSTGGARAPVFIRGQGLDHPVEIIGPDGLGRRMQRRKEDNPYQKNP